MFLIRSSLVLLSCYGILMANCNAVKNNRQNARRFPEGFLFGTSTASYQIEGAWNEDGKTESIWDTITHRTPSPIEDESSGDIANDSYRLYERDIEMMRELGIDYYRFSISWPRILPNGFANEINEAGVTYYNNVITELLRYNITPMITIYHWDMPQKLQDLGGWANPDMVDWYGDYARVLFQLFGDRVQTWITVNEPREICRRGYGVGNLAPGIALSGEADYMCVKNLLLAHATAYHIYDDEFRPTQGGTIFISINCSWNEPETDSEEDMIVAEEANLFDWGQYTHPIFSATGDFPQVMKERVAAKSMAQGYPRSRLPEFTPEQVDFIRGTSDIFGLNHYTTYLVYRNESVIGYHPSPSYNDDVEVISYQRDEWYVPGSHPRVRRTPWGLYNLLRKLSDMYNNVPIFITEGGCSTYTGLEDNDRVDYLRVYMDAVLDAMDAGSDILGYTVWSLMDNFEWFSGYSRRYGLYEVDYDSPNRTRTARKSAFVFKEILRTRTLDFDYEPATSVMTIAEGH